MAEFETEIPSMELLHTTTTASGMDAAAEALEQRALTVVENYQRAVQGSLVVGALEETADAVGKVLRDLMDTHRSSVAQLTEMNAALCQKLVDSSADIAELRSQLAAITPAGAGIPKAEGAEEAMDAAAVGDKEVQTVIATDSSAGTLRTVCGDDSCATEHHTSSTTVAPPTAEKEASGTDGLTVNLLENPAALAALVAAHAAAKGALGLMEGRQGQFKANCVELARLLTRATHDSAQARAEVEVLKATTVPRHAYEEAVRERDEAQQDCALLRMQAALLSEQLDAAEAQRAVEEEKKSVNEAARALTTSVAAVVSEEAEGAPETITPHAHAGLWGLAIRELEEQATVAASQQDLRVRLAAAEELVSQLSDEKAQLTTALDVLQKEDTCLRSDAQAMAYRNGILSQQVSSLLMKVEYLKRALRAATATTAADANGSDGDCSVGAASSSSSVWTNKEMRINGEEPRSGGPTRRHQHARPWSRPGLAPAAPRSHSSRDNALVAVEAQHLLQKRAMPGGGGWGPNSLLSSSSLLSQRRTHEETLPPQEVSTARGRRVEPHGPKQGHSPATLLGTGPLDIPFTPAPQCGGDLEVERGLQGSLSTFSMRRRSVTLRNLGCGALEVAMPCHPRLPACDQLSGTALGRPSSYSVLDPLNGTTTRQGTSAELALLRSSGRGPVVDVESEDAQQHAPASLDSFLSGSGMEEVTDLLAMLEADEDLGCFSVNSVAELVERNQELVKQLYEVTQRAEAAESGLRGQVGSVGGQHSSATPQSMHEKSVFRTTASPTAREDRPALVLSDSEAARHGSTGRTSETAAVPPHKRPRDETGDATAHHSASRLCKDRGPSAIAPYSNEDTGPGDVAVTTVSKDLQASVADLVDAMVQKHRTHQLLTDETIAGSLLGVLDTLQGQQMQRDAALHGRASASEMVLGSLVSSLVELCSSQATALASQGAQLGAVREADRAASRASWAAAQDLLGRTVQDLREAVLLLLPRHVPALAPPSGLSAASSSPPGSTVTASTQPGAEEAVLLERIMELLQAATLKDHTVQRIYHSAHERQAGFVRRKERKILRLAAKTKARAEAAQALSETTAMVSATNTAAATTTPIAAPGTPLQRHTSASPLPPPAPLPEGFAGLEHSHQVLLGTAVAAGVARHTSRSAPHDATADLADQHRGCGEGGCVEAVFSSNSSDDDSMMDGDSLLFMGLRQQLALAQAQHKAVADDLHAEKSRHIELCERMWKLETEMEEAYKEKVEALAAMETMVQRGEYEVIVADLDSAKALVEDLEAQLKYSHQERNKLLTQLDVLQHQVNTHQQQLQSATAELMGAVQTMGTELAAERERGTLMHVSNAELTAQVASLQDEAQEHVEKLVQLQLEKSRVENLLAESRQLLLSDDRSQATLLAMYPGDSALVANVELVSTQRDMVEHLRGELSTVSARVAELEATVRARDRVIRAATQQRQDAEARLQALAAREATLSEVRVVERKTDGEAAVTDVDYRPSTEKDADADGLPMTAVVVSTRALQSRLQELESQLEAAQRELQILHTAESAWKSREEQLRQQLDIMSRDPVSEAARRYGLVACSTFESQMATLHTRCEQLSGEVAQHAASQQTLTQEIARSAEAVQSAESRVAELQHSLRTATEKVESLQHASAELAAQLKTQVEQGTQDRDTIAAHEDSMKNLEHGLAALEQERENLQGSLTKCKTERDKFYEDNRKLIGKVTELQRDLQQSDEEKRAATAALAQGMSSASYRQRAHGRRGLLGRVSVTGDLSSLAATTPTQQPPSGAHMNG